MLMHFDLAGGNLAVCGKFAMQDHNYNMHLVCSVFQLQFKRQLERMVTKKYSA